MKGRIVVVGASSTAWRHCLAWWRNCRPTSGLRSSSSSMWRPTGLAVLLCAQAFAAVQYGVTRDGRRLAMGGVGQEEDAQMRLQSFAYSLSLLMASRGSGAYLSDVQVDIRDARGELAFSGLVDGPRLMIMLNPGTYRIVALYGGETLVQSVSIVARGHRELVFYFQLPGE